MIYSDVSQKLIIKKIHFYDIDMLYIFMKHFLQDIYKIIRFLFKIISLEYFKTKILIINLIANNF